KPCARMGSLGSRLRSRTKSARGNQRQGLYRRGRRPSRACSRKRYLSLALLDVNDLPRRSRIPRKSDWLLLLMPLSAQWFIPPTWKRRLRSSSPRSEPRYAEWLSNQNSSTIVAPLSCNLLSHLAEPDLFDCSRLLL